MRCAGVGAGMLDENPWLNKLGSVIGTSDGGMSPSEGGQWGGSGAASFSKFSKSDASAEIQLELNAQLKKCLSLGPLRKVP